MLVPVEEVLEEWMQDPEFRVEAERLEPAYQLANLRIQAGLTQEELAALVGTHQSSIARFESGKRAPSWDLMQRVAEALGFVVQVQFVPRADPAI